MSVDFERISSHGIEEKPQPIRLDHTPYSRTR
jgi:hypothetical protein